MLRGRLLSSEREHGPIGRDPTMPATARRRRNMPPARANAISAAQKRKGGPRLCRSGLVSDASSSLKSPFGPAFRREGTSAQHGLQQAAASHMASYGLERSSSTKMET